MTIKLELPPWVNPKLPVQWVEIKLQVPVDWHWDETGMPSHQLIYWATQNIEEALSQHFKRPVPSASDASGSPR